MARKPFDLCWTESAVLDLDGILDYIAQRDSVTAATHVFERLSDRIESLRSLPLRCRIVPELRELNLHEFHELVVSPYRIVFRVQARSVVLVAILDGRRDFGELLLQRALMR
ncbi:MAG: type II toxin-antitoxin system RelE/ParE family toxin [Planctomycetota bacterium]